MALTYNADGSVRLSTIRFDALLDKGVEQGGITSEIRQQAKALLNDAEEKMRSVKTLIDKTTFVLLDETEPESEENPSVLVELDQPVVYWKRKNPSATPEKKKESAQRREVKRKSVISEKLAELSAQRIAGTLSEDEYNKKVLALI